MLLKFILISCFVLIGLANGYARVKLCVIRQIELNKCIDIRQVLQDKQNIWKVFIDRLDCILADVDGCIQKIKNNEADIMVMDSKAQHLAFDKGLRTILWENYRNDDVIVAITNENLTLTDIKNYPLNFDVKDLRLVHSAVYFNKVRYGQNTCEIKQSKENENGIGFLRANFFKFINIFNLKISKKLICKDLTLRDWTDYHRCNFETGPVNAVISRGDIDLERRGEIIIVFNLIVNFFGPHGVLNDNIRLFGNYKGERDVIFNDDTQSFSPTRMEVNGVNEMQMKEMLCDGNMFEI